MTSSGAMTEFRNGPLYLFDQARKRNRVKGTISNVLYSSVANEEAHEDTIQSGANSSRSCKGQLSQKLPVNMIHHDPMDAYKRAAPRLLNELARLLSQHKWSEKACIPLGMVNILNYSWQDLTAGASHLKSPEQTDPPESKGSLKFDEARPREVSAGDDKRKAGERNSCAVENDALSVSSNPRVKKRKRNKKKAQSSTTVSYSISSSSSKHPGWIIQSRQPSCDELQWISLCQRVVECLQVARNPQKMQITEQDLKKPLLLCHYGDAKAKLKDRGKAQLASVVSGKPQKPKVKQKDTAETKQKLHYRIDDGSSFIYYPTGCVAVCQSHSGLPCGGFYTNVFSDSERPVILATITAFGHGAATNPLSSAITAVWDQDGGFLCDHDGNKTKEWSWQTRCTLKEKIVIQLSDLISVRLLSGTSATLSFRCKNESVQLPLSAISNINRTKNTANSCLQTAGKFTSNAAQDLLQISKSPAVIPESKRRLMPTPVSVCSREVLQMVSEVEEPSALWRKGGHVGRELKRLQRRIRSTLEDWMDYYCVAIGIKCPDKKRMPDAPPRTRLKREVQSAALPSLNSPEQTDAKPVQPREARTELQELHRHPAATAAAAAAAAAKRDLNSNVKLPRAPKRRTKEEARVTHIGPLRIHGNIDPESVIIPNSPDLQPPAVSPCPAQKLFTPSVPLTVCPALLRAALLGEGGRRRCCCSTKLMPVVTDLEYDAFIMGQPPHSQQILVVCVTPSQQPVNTHTSPDQDVLDQLYRRRNKQRLMPCTQCQMDSFRLVRYEMSTEKPSCGVENILLQQRHNAAPGMVLMYIRGKLLFVGFVFTGHSCSVKDLQKQISKSRREYRSGLSLPSDYKFSDTVNNTPAATVAHSSQDATLKEGDDTTLKVSTEKTNKRK